MTYVLQLAGIWTNLKRAFPVLLRELRSHLARQRLPKEPLHAIQAGGATFRYLDVGNGDPVVMLHGYPQNHDCWRHQIAALRSRFRVIAPDLPGWGASDRRLDLHYDYDAEVGRLIEFFDGLGLRNVHLLAHDYGGYLALGLARARPDLVNRLVVLNSRAHGTFKARWKLLFVPTLRWLSQIPALGRLAKWMPVGRLHRLFLRRELREGIFDGPAAKSYLGHLTPGSHGTKWLLRFFAPGRGYSFVPQPSLRTGHAEGLRNLVVWGTEDTFLSSHLARELTEGLPHCTLKWLPGVGHYVMEEAPDEVTAALRGFLQD
jgi:pimeloyl-ACP methyl ester carboxylesterase